MALLERLTCLLRFAGIHAIKYLTDWIFRVFVDTEVHSQEHGSTTSKTNLGYEKASFNHKSA